MATTGSQVDFCIPHCMNGTIKDVKDIVSVPGSPTTVDCEIKCLQKEKLIQFTTTTTYFFNVAHGGSSLPRESGPAIGMEHRHCRFQSDTVPMATKPSRARKWTHLERVQLLKNAEYTGLEIASFCMEAIQIRKSRRETRKGKKRQTTDTTNEAIQSKRRVVHSTSTIDDDTYN